MNLKFEQRRRTGGYLLAGLLLSGGVHAVIWQQLQQPEMSVAAAVPVSYQPVMLMAQAVPPLPAEAPLPETVQAPEPKPEPRVVPKPVKPKPKPRPKPQPEPVLQSRPQKAVAESPPVAATNPVNSAQPVAPVITAEQQRQRFLALLVQRIDHHKRYPKRAQSRGIEGRVSFKLSLDSHGALQNFEWLEGNRLFYQATLEAVQRSLPLPLPDGQGAFSYRLALDYKLL